MGVYIYQSGTEKSLKNAYIGEYVPPYLCFTANTAGSTIKITYNGSTYYSNIQTSTDGANWNNYSISTTITLSNIGDKIYFRRNADTPQAFSISYQNRHYFVMTGSIAASGDVTTLLCKEGTTDLTASGVYCFGYLFNNCTSLTTTPKLPATTLTTNCYTGMFSGCTGLTELPSLKATSISEKAYSFMFNGCTGIKLSTTQTGEYQTEYRIPSEGTGTAYYQGLNSMFNSTGGTFTGTPSINTTYYTSNTVV